MIQAIVAVVILSAMALLGFISISTLTHPPADATIVGLILVCGLVVFCFSPILLGLLIAIYVLNLIL